MIDTPTEMNNVALNIAWVRRWIKQNVTIFRLSVTIISPSCLRVDSATVFFWSGCADAHIAPNNAVNNPDDSKILLKAFVSERNG